MIKISNYIIRNYKGKYRLKAPIDLSTNDFPRKLNGTFEDIDVYIDCYNGIKIFSYGHGTLESYIPSIKKGRNIIKEIKSNFGEDIVFDIKELDSELLFKFKANDMSKFEKYLKPKTNGAKISPFSVRNIKNKAYNIPDEELSVYKNITSNLPKERMIDITHTTIRFIKSLATKRNTYESIKQDMKKKCMKNKEYIHSIGKWDEYIKYLQENL